MRPPTYHTKRFTLKPLESKDEDRFVEMGLDKETVRFMGGANGVEAEDRALFQKGLALYERNDKRWFWLWGIYEQERFCGNLEMKETEHTQDNELEIVYCVHPAERGKGLMSEVLEFLKSNQALWERRIIATVSPENEKSLALLEKWGIERKEPVMDDDTGEHYFKIILAE